MITAKSLGEKYVTQLTDGRGHYIFADVPDSGGGDRYQRPGELLAEAYAACMNITARKILNEKGLDCEEVVTRVDMDRSDPAKLVFHYDTQIVGDVPQSVRDEIAEALKNCPVCQLLRAEKEFLPL